MRVTFCASFSFLCDWWLVIGDWWLVTSDSWLGDEVGSGTDDSYRYRHFDRSYLCLMMIESWNAMCRRVEKSRSTSGKGFLLQVITVKLYFEQSENGSYIELLWTVSSSPYRLCWTFSTQGPKSIYTFFFILYKYDRSKWRLGVISIS